MRAFRVWDIGGVAFTFIGTVIGAGFASGKEIMQFFCVCGRWGLVGVVLASLVMAFFGVIVLVAARRLRTDSFRLVAENYLGSKLGLFTENLVSVFLFGGYVIMLAGGGALFHEHLGLPVMVGVVLMAIASTVTVVRGISGIRFVNSALVPLLLIATTAMFLMYRTDALTLKPLTFNACDSNEWFLYSLIYAGYNLILAVPVLCSLWKTCDSDFALGAGGILGASGIGFMAFILCLILMSFSSSIAGYEIPTLGIANNYGKFFKGLFIVVIWEEMFTTAISSLFGVVKRISSSEQRFPLIVIAVSLVAIPMSFSGFGRLIFVIYPAFGYLSLGILLWGVFRIVRARILRISMGR